MGILFLSLHNGCDRVRGTLFRPNSEINRIAPRIKPLIRVAKAPFPFARFHKSPKVGLIGFGMSGQVFHAPMINAVSELRLSKVVELHKEESKRTYPWVEVVTDIDDVLNDEAIDVVAIATPNSSHFELTKRALLAGKHTVVDKPFTITSHEAQQLIDLANQTNKLLSVFQNRRWDSSFKTVQQVINLNLVGELVEYESHLGTYIEDK